MKTNLMKGASFLAAMMMVTMGLSTVMAGPQLPFDRLGDTTYNTQLVCSWVDGVEYGNATTSATGYLEISTAGDDTVEDNIQTGADVGNTIQYSVGRLTGATARFFAVAENDVYAAGGSFTGDLAADAADTVLLKIDIVASQATAGVTDYVVIYNPHTAIVNAATYSLAVGTAAAQPIIAGDIVAGLATNNDINIPAGGSLAINMVKWGGLSNTGNSVKLLLATRVVDRVEYGTIATAPENTLMSNAANPTSGNEIYRNAHADTNMCLADFASRAQTIIPDVTAPTITTIVPTDGATGVALNAAVTVTWSEAMRTTGMSVTINPAPLVAGTWAWSVGNTVYTYSGATWRENLLYTLTFVGFADVVGNAAGGDLVKTFTTLSVAPTITSIVPNDGATGVALNAVVTATWSEAMTTTGMSVAIVPAPLVAGTWAWSVGNTVYTYTGATWRENQAYTLTFNGFTDANAVAAGGDLVKTFTTLSVAPTITTIVPADGATGVAITSTVVVTWSEAMSTSGMSVTINPARTGTWVWSAGNTVYTFTPGGNWAESTLYTLTFVGFTDANAVAAGGDLVKTFTTADVTGPTITTIVPNDGATGVALGSTVVVTWSEAMGMTGTVSIVPAPLTAGAWVWSAGNTVYTYSGATWRENQLYTLTFNGFTDVAGNPATGDLVKTFTTLSVAPTITTIVPADGATGVAITSTVVVTWSEAMSTSGMSVTINPARTGTWVWSAGNTVYTFTPAANWASATLYTLTFVGFTDANAVAAGGDLVKTFTTVGSNPTILSIVPADGATGVAITTTVVVTWDLAMNPAVGTVAIVPAKAGTWAWSGANTIYTFTPTGDWTASTLYTLTFNNFASAGGQAATGDLVKTFTTAGGETVATATGLNVVKSGTNNVVISWTNPAGSNFWDIYASTNKATVKQPANLLGTVAQGTGTYTHVNGQTTGTTLFYLVIGRGSAGTEAAYSTMGVKLHKSFTLNVGKTNIMWMTIPQNAGYATASDIVMELEGALVGAGLATKINAIYQWNPSGQYGNPFLYDSDFEEWTGTDFAIAPGDGIAFSITSSFNWVVCGVDVGSQLSFTLNVGKTNIMWFNLPATSTYTTASDIVMELEGALVGAGLATKINAIYQWNPSGQYGNPFLYDSDFEEWTGTDFTIAPGDGIAISITSTFNWTPALITPIVP